MLDSTRNESEMVNILVWTQMNNYHYMDKCPCNIKCYRTIRHLRPYLSLRQWIQDFYYFMSVACDLDSNMVGYQKRNNATFVINFFPSGVLFVPFDNVPYPKSVSLSTKKALYDMN